MLEPGEEVQTSAPADFGQTYEPFQYRTLLQVSAALGVPYRAQAVPNGAAVRPLVTCCRNGLVQCVYVPI